MATGATGNSEQYDHARIERLLFDASLAARGGWLYPDPDPAGLELTPKASEAAQYEQRL